MFLYGTFMIYASLSTISRIPTIIKYENSYKSKDRGSIFSRPREFCDTFSHDIATTHNTHTCLRELELPSRREEILREISVCRKILEVRQKPKEREKKWRKVVSRRKCNERARERTFISLQRHVAAGTGRERHRI